ncbi:hypothetical protein SDC9_66798 [bioreactor metagenome]|uniref:Uncharacterized protein n=1 Tax=bioreactor metagenome TaxID=1076179 RepID=A0A644XW95_9ZZZZ
MLHGDGRVPDHLLQGEVGARLLHLEAGLVLYAAPDIGHTDNKHGGRLHPRLAVGSLRQRPFRLGRPHHDKPPRLGIVPRRRHPGALQKLKDKLVLHVPSGKFTHAAPRPDGFDHLHSSPEIFHIPIHSTDTEKHVNQPLCTTIYRSLSDEQNQRQLLPVDDR